METSNRSKEDYEREARDINYYFILGLEYDPPETNLDIIKERIDKCKLFWSTKANDPHHGLLYKMYSSTLFLDNKIIEDMTDVTGRTVHSNIAKSLVSDRIEKYLKAACTHSKIISHERVANIVSTINQQLEHELPKVAVLGVDSKGSLKKAKFVTDELVSKKASTLGLCVSEKINYRAVYAKYYLNPPSGLDKNTDIASYNGYATPLASAGKRNLYDFLGMNKEESAQALYNAANSRYGKVTKHNNEADIEKQLAAAARNVFKNDYDKKKYDLYLLWHVRQDILDSLNERNLAGTLQESDYRTFISELISVGIPKDDVAKVITAYCHIEKILPPWSFEDDSNPSNFVVCRVCHTLQNADETATCSRCRTRLLIQCPTCGKETAIGIADDTCIHCQTNLNGVGKAIIKYHEARKALEILDYSLAGLYLQDADKLWPKSLESKEILNEIQRSKNEYGTALEDIKKTAAEKRYFAAKKLYSDLQKRVPGYHDDSLERDTDSAIKASNEYYRKITPNSTEKEVLSVCSTAARICLDNPDIVKLMARYPPESAKNLTVSLDNKTHVINLKWDKSSSDGEVSYVVVRKENNAPINSEDGELVKNAAISSYTDNELEAGKCYYYAVFALRAGVYSSATLMKDAVITNYDISNLKLTPENKAVRISWRHTPETSSVQIQRNGTVLQNIPANGYLDTGLQNEVEYTYKVRLVYSIRGKTYESGWVEEKTTPSLPPDPISTLRIRSLKNNQYQASWDYSGMEKFEFYCSVSKPTYKLGDVVSLSNLSVEMQKLPVSITENSAVFQHSSPDTLYVTAVIIKKGSCCIGNIVRVSNGEIVSIKDVKLVNGDIVIWLDTYPKDTNAFKIMYSYDAFPSDPDDKSHPIDQKKYVKIKEFLRTNTLIIPFPYEKNYYITVFAEVKGDNGATNFPASGEIFFSNLPMKTITYSISSRRGFKKKTLMITFESENKFTLPEIEICYAPGRGYPPIYKEHGTILQTIQRQPVNKSLSVELLLPHPIPKGSHIKPFLADEGRAQKIELTLKNGSTTLISY